jgi:hypothetical protein
MLSGMKGPVTAAGDSSRCHATARTAHTGSYTFTSNNVSSTMEAYEIAAILLFDLPQKSRTDHERTQTLDSPSDLFSTSYCALHPRGGAAHLLNLCQGTLLIVSRLAPAIRITLCSRRRFVVTMLLARL